MYIPSPAPSPCASRFTSQLSERLLFTGELSYEISGSCNFTKSIIKEMITTTTNTNSPHLKVPMPQHATVQEHYGHQHLYQQPHNDIRCLRLAKQITGILNAQYRFAHHNRTVHPALCAHALATRVRDVDVVLAHRWRHEQTDQHQSAGDQRMRWRHLENMLEKERIQFGDLPEDHQLTYAPRAHVRGLGIEPSDRRPAARCELQDGPFDFAARR